MGIRAFDDWLYDKIELEELAPECRWIFNAANLTTGARFGFVENRLTLPVRAFVQDAGDHFYLVPGQALEDR